MNKKNLLRTIFINILYIVALIVAVALVSAMVASIGAIITDNINLIVIACLISVWITILISNILKYYITFRKKTKELNKTNAEEYKAESNKLKMRNIIKIIISSIFIGIILYNLKNKLVDSIENGTNINENIYNSTSFYLKIGITVILVIIFIVKIILKKKNDQKDNKNSPNVV
jgi:hypothetical protein